jgi:hypothetical protein
MRVFFKLLIKTDDKPALILFALIGLVFAWNLALPMSHTLQEAGLKRYHLASGNYYAWAVQQPIPSIYNFENRYWLGREQLPDAALTQETVRQSPGASLTSGGVVMARKNVDMFRSANQALDSSTTPAAVQSEAINHFPTRVMTYAAARRKLGENPNGFFVIKTAYRKKKIKSVFETVKKSENEIEVRRLETEIE